MFERTHHQLIAEVLSALDAKFLQENNCLFGGGTAIVLSHGEYRESVDMDFLVSDLPSYRNIRQLLNGSTGIEAILKKDTARSIQAREIRADQYGVRTTLRINKQNIKFEIVLEGRIQLETPLADEAICGISTLTRRDMLTSKLLANSDRWRDDGVFSRDLIDLAMMAPSKKYLTEAITKASLAYGDSILKDLKKAISSIKIRQGWLDRCMGAMFITLPKAVLWQRVCDLESRLGS